MSDDDLLTMIQAAETAGDLNPHILEGRPAAADVRRPHNMLPKRHIVVRFASNHSRIIDLNPLQAAIQVHCTIG